MATSLLVSGSGSGSSGLNAMDLMVVVLLVSLLITKEIMTLVPLPQARAVGQILNIGVVPLLIVFGVSIAVRLVPSTS